MDNQRYDTRRSRAVSQKIYLIHLDTNTNDSQIIFHILGTTKTIYTIIFEKGMGPVCSCPDYKLRKNICKHIYFILTKLLNNISVYDWLKIDKLDNIKDKLNKMLPQLNVKPDDYYIKLYEKHLNGVNENNLETKYRRNDDCCICISKIENNDTVIVCQICSNALHYNCWNRWKEVKNDTLCVYCRNIIKGISVTVTNDLFGNVKLIDN